MGIEVRTFFIAAGKSLEQAEAFAADLRSCRARARAWAKELGVDEFSFDCRRGFKAMKFTGPAPKGWRRHPHERDWFTPSDGRGAEAMAVRAKADECRPDTRVPGKSFTVESVLYWPTLQFIDGKWVISQHMDATPVPPDAVQMKRSEYMAMVETQEGGPSASRADLGTCLDNFGQI